MMYYRIMDSNRSIFEDAKKGAFHESPFSRDELLEMQENDITPPVDPENVFFDEHSQKWIEVLYENAVCCVEDPRSLLDYAGWGAGNSKVVEFEGEYLDSLPDGEAVRPIKVIREYTLEEFEMKYHG